MAEQQTQLCNVSSRAAFFQKAAKAVVFRRLMNIWPKEWGAEQHPQPWATEVTPSEIHEEYHPTVGMAVYHLAFHTAPQEALARLHAQCNEMGIPPPPHGDWASIEEMTRDLVVHDMGDHVSQHRVFPPSDYHRLFLALGLLPSDQQHPTDGTWRQRLWKWPGLNAHSLMQLANAVAPRHARRGWEGAFCDGDEIEEVLTLVREDEEGEELVLDARTPLNPT